MTFVSGSTNAPLSLPSDQPRLKQTKLREAADGLEASFIAEMLKSAGVGKSRDTFGGGEGEDGFASFLVTAQAEMIVKAGGFGLADKIYESLAKEAGFDDQ
jgi:flagellar protein FlgJ